MAECNFARCLREVQKNYRATNQAGSGGLQHVDTVLIPSTSTRCSFVLQDPAEKTSGWAEELAGGV